MALSSRMPGDLKISKTSIDATTIAGIFVGSQTFGSAADVEAGIFLDDDHFENPPLRSPSMPPPALYVSVNTTGNGPRIHMHGGSMQTDAGSGTLTAFINVNGADTVEVVGTEFGSHGQTVTSIVNCNAIATWVSLAPVVLDTHTAADVASCPGAVADLEMRNVNAFWKLTGVPVTFSGSPVTVTGAGRFKLSDQGLCTMTSGFCPAQTFNSTYSVAPQCFASWDASASPLTGIIKIATTLTQVTISSSVSTDTPQMNWVCFGN
jgi:hypothetical protein